VRYKLLLGVFITAGDDVYSRRELREAGRARRAGNRPRGKARVIVSLNHTEVGCALAPLVAARLRKCTCMYAFPTRTLEY
jgi:hypothetical protein